MNEPIKLQTDQVILHNIDTGTKRPTLRIYAERKSSANPVKYKIIEVCPNQPMELKMNQNS